MGADFNIKPAGAPVAAPFVQPASPAVDEAVATELPAAKSVAAADSSARVRNDPQAADNTHLSHDVVIDRAANSVVYRVVDNRTNLVIRQFPDDAILRRRAYARALDEMKQAPRLVAVDRKI